MSTENQLPERITVSTEVMNEVLNVLAQLPYAQSAAIIQKVQGDIRSDDGANTKVSAVPSKEAVNE